MNVVEGICVVLAAVTALIAVVGIAASADAYGRLMYGSIPGGASLIALALAVACHKGLAVETTQAVVLVLLAVPSGAVAAHRIAAVIHEREQDDDEPAEAAPE